MLLIFVIWVIAGFRLMFESIRGFSFLLLPLCVLQPVCSHSSRVNKKEVRFWSLACFGLIVMSVSFFPCFVARLFKWQTRSKQGLIPPHTQHCAVLCVLSSQRYNLQSVPGESQFSWLGLWVSSLSGVFAWYLPHLQGGHHRSAGSSPMPFSCFLSQKINCFCSWHNQQRNNPQVDQSKELQEISLDSQTGSKIKTVLHFY